MNVDVTKLQCCSADSKQRPKPIALKTDFICLVTQKTHIMAKLTG